MSITRHHNDWLRLVPNSGPFLSLPVLATAFPQGLHAHDADHARRLRLAFDEWDDNQLSQRPDPSLHRAWIKFVLGETLGYGELLAEGQEIPQALKSDVAEYGETLRPDWIVNDPATKKPRLLIQVYPRSQSLTKPVAGRRWNAWPDGRMMQLLHDTGIRLGIVTNGDHWMLVNAPKNETTGYASWYASLWLEEPVTLRAFRTVLGADRLFSVPDNETLEALLDKSASDQQEVTDQLGYQVRKAVEVLIQALDKSDQEHGRKLLADVDEKVLYESALTVMMRLVFLFCAEERELLLLGDELYDKNYAVSTLREQLRVTADQFGEEILGLRFDAWIRLLTTFRAVYAGVKHDRLKLPAYGGSLFNPDRFPFLEGRTTNNTNNTNKGNSHSSSDSCDSCDSWLNTPAEPLPVSNRTVLHLLEALQVLQTKVGNTTEARNLSFRSLDIEQIGHVYEGLLDHTAKRATEPVLGLAGTRDKEPEIALAELERKASRGRESPEFLKFLKDETGRSESALKKCLNAELEDQLATRFRTVCQDSDLWKRVKPFAGLVRLDTLGYPVVITTGSVFVTSGTDRRSTGTHYTPKSLTEPIVQYTLEPLVFVGPAEGLPKEQWTLRSAKELLDLRICDMACGSGAFLVQACRYMAARLLEAWKAATANNTNNTNEHKDKPTLINPKTGELVFPSSSDSLDSCYSWLTLPADDGERQTYALRIVAQRCMYGVDKNPLAAEMAKLSLWLLTLAKDKPFEFLDHAIRCGDSLVGIHNTEQLRKFNLDGKGEDNRLFLHFLDEKIKEAIALRRQITEMQANTVEDVETQDRMLREANEKIDRLKCSADMLISAEFYPGSAADKRSARDDAAIKVAVHFQDSDLATFRQEATKALAGQVTFHWPLEFPEVMVERGGFDGFVGNPPFMGGKKILGRIGEGYFSFINNHLGKGVKGSSDLCAFFFLRAFATVNSSGTFGLIATNTIAQSGTREVGLQQLEDSGGKFIRAEPDSQWPGDANLAVSCIWIKKGRWDSPCYLKGQPFPRLSSSLDIPSTVGGKAYRLLSNARLAFIGTITMGTGFLITPEEAAELIARDAKNKDVLFPFLNGDDFNTHPEQSPSRWAINFHEWSFEKASQYKDCMDILTAHVKPFRESLTTKQIHESDYWKFWDKRVESYATIQAYSHTLTGVLHTKYWCVEYAPTRTVFSHALVVFCRNDPWFFAVLQSAFHEAWAREHSSSLETRMRYTPTTCLETFPFPLNTHPLEGIAKVVHSHRRQVMLTRCEGLTDTYNRFHDPDEASADIQKLRRLHIEMDNAVAAAYGWTDLDLGHGFHETKQGVRFTISEPARREVLARLLTLNHERYADEVKQGLHEKRPRNTRKTRKKAEEGGGLFG